MWILTLLLLTGITGITGTEGNGLECNITETTLKCRLNTGYDNLSAIVDTHKDNLTQIEKFCLSIGNESNPHKPPNGSKGIIYPKWGLLVKLRDIQMSIYVKTGVNGNYQYFTNESMNGTDLHSFQLLSNSTVVSLRIEYLSKLSNLTQIWIAGATIDTQTGWKNLTQLTDLKLIGMQNGTMDIGELALDKLEKLQLELSQIEGVDPESAEQMTSLKNLSISVETPQPLSVQFIQKLAAQLSTLLLSGFNMGNFSSGSLSTDSAIQNLTIRNSSNTVLVASSAFSSNQLISFEISQMAALSLVEDGFVSLSSKLVNLTVTNMPALTQLPKSFGEWVKPKFVQLSNNPNLVQVPVDLFKQFQAWNSTGPEVLDVTMTKLDKLCPCQASYLAAMATANHTIHSSCLKNWTNGLCEKGKNCWIFQQNCSYECSAGANPYNYSCLCNTSEILLPNNYTCDSKNNCSVLEVDKLFCKKYNATCKLSGKFYTCSCQANHIWEKNKLVCIGNNPFPLVTNTTIAPTNTTMTSNPTNSTAPGTLPVWEIAVVSVVPAVVLLCLCVLILVPAGLCYRKKWKRKQERGYALLIQK